MEGEPKRTALYESHISSNAKMINFHGYELPIWFSSIREEHTQTRNNCGLFDVSHMGFFCFSGQGVSEWLSSIATQDFSKFNAGSCGYSHFLDYNGHIIDDMIFAISSDTEVFGVPNSSMIEHMWIWLSNLLPKDQSIFIQNLSEQTSILSLQGPSASRVLEDTLGGNNVVSRFRCQNIHENKLGITGWIQGTGYTGEPGVEIFLANNEAEKLWRALISHSEVNAVGLGARDTLRLEKGYLLSGQDFRWPGIGGSISENEDFPKGFLARNTIETAVPFGLDLSHDFIGKEALVEPKDKNIRLWGVRCIDRGPAPRAGNPVMSGGNEDSSIIGYVTSGAPSPSGDLLGIGLAYLEGQKEGNNVWIKASKRKIIQCVVKKPPFN